MGHPAQIPLTERLRSVEAEIAAGRAESALPRCLEIATLYPRALAVQRVLGEIYLALRKPREALAALDRALAGDPEDARACCARAIVHQMHGDQLAALAWYRRACDIRPEDASIRATYREMAAGLGQPPYQPGRVGLARFYLRGDLFTHAIREWEMLIAENADSTRLEAHVGLVEALWRAGRAREAEAWARRTLTNVPSCLKPLLIAAVIAHDEGRDADAEPFLRRAADLDPDHRAARALFADRLGAGDIALGKLIWGETPPDTFNPGAANPPAPWADAPQGPAPSSNPSSGQRVTQPAERRINRPLVTGEPVNTGSLSRPDLTAPPAAPLPPPQPRPNDLPSNFRSMFKETEGMLWKPGESDPDALRGAPPRATGAPQGARVTQAPAPRDAGPAQPMGPAPDAMAPPPAIAESGFALGDTEMRRAIRWVQWLQAQGARTLGDEPQRSRPTGSLDALLNSPTGGARPAPPSAAPPSPPVTQLPSLPSHPSGSLSPPTAPSLPSLPSLPSSLPSLPSLPSSLPSLPSQPSSLPSLPSQPSSLPSLPSQPSSAPSLPSQPSSAPSLPSQPSGPLPPPSSADLRQMFAELEPPPVADANVPAWPEVLAEALNWPDDGPRDERESGRESERARVTGGPAAPIEAQPTGPMTPPPETPATPASRPDPSPDATIEELERQGAADGFTPFALQPGSLAAMAGATAEHGPQRQGGDDWLETRAPEEPAAPREEPQTELSAAPLPYDDAEPTAPYNDAEPVAPYDDAEPVAPREPLLSEPLLEPLAEPAAAPDELPAESQPEGPDPHDYTARLEQARGHRDSGALDEAIVEYRTVVRNAPDLLPDVLSDVEGCLTERPEHPELHRLLGDARIRQGDYLGALESYNRAVALSQTLDS